MVVKFDDVLGLKAAVEQAKKSANEGGVPIGLSIIANVDGELEVIGASHNQRIQKDSAILHGE
ncbi:cytosine deaminase, partial [Phellopilus nigrolimitatus]